MSRPQIPDFDSLFNAAPERGAAPPPQKEAQVPDFGALFDSAPTVGEAANAAVPEPDLFGMAPGAMRPTDILTGAGAGIADLILGLGQMFTGGVGEAVQLPANIAYSPEKIGETYRKVTGYDPLSVLAEHGVITPEAEAMRKSAGILFGVPAAVTDPLAEKAFELPTVDPLTGEIISQTSPNLAATIKTAGEAAPVLPLAWGGMKIAKRGIREAGEAVAEAIPEGFLFKSKAGKSWTAKEVGDILRATDESTIDPDLLRSFKELSPEEKSQAVRGAGINLEEVEPTWLGKLLGKEAKPPTAKPGKGGKKGPPEEPPAPEPTEPIGDLPPGPEPEPGGAEVAPPAAPEVPPNAISTVFGSEVAARAAAEAYKKNDFRTLVEPEGNKWAVRRWKPTPEEVAAAIDQAPEVGAVPSPPVPGESVSVAPPVPPQGPTEPPQPPSPPEVVEEKRSVPRKERSSYAEKDIPDLETAESDLEIARESLKYREKDYAEAIKDPNLGLREQIALDTGIEGFRKSVKLIEERIAELKAQKEAPAEEGIGKDMWEEEARGASQTLGLEVRYVGEETNVDPPWQMFEVKEPGGQRPSFYLKPGQNLVERAKEVVTSFAKKQTGVPPEVAKEAEVFPDQELDFSLRNWMQEEGITGRYVNEEDLAKEFDLTPDEAHKLWRYGVDENLIDPEPPGFDDVREDEGPPEEEEATVTWKKAKIVPTREGVKAIPDWESNAVDQILDDMSYGNKFRKVFVNRKFKDFTQDQIDKIWENLKKRSDMTPEDEWGYIGLKEEFLRDTKDKTGIPSEIRKGEKPLETKPHEETGREEIAPSGILQTPGPRPTPGEEATEKAAGEADREEGPVPQEIALSNKELTERQYSIGDTVYFKTGWNKEPQKISHINSNGEIRVEGSKATYSPTEFTKESPEGKAPPVPAEIAKEPHFVSGMTRPGDFDAAVATGADIGVELQEASGPMMKKIGDATRTSKIFVDNGAFNAFKRIQKAKKEGKSEAEIAKLRINWPKTVRKYEALLDLAVNPKNLVFVAPDEIGDPEATHKQQNNWSGNFYDMADAGVEVVWPMQKAGPLQDETGEDWDFNTTVPYHRDWFDNLVRQYGKVVMGTLPDGRPSYKYPYDEANKSKVIVGIPANEEAWSPEEVGRLVKALGIRRAHLLGIGPQNKNYDAYIAAAREANKDIEITTDASPSGLRRPDLAAARDQATGIADDTEIYREILGTKVLSEKGAELLADKLPLEEFGLDKREFVNDAFNGDVFDAMTEGEKYGPLVDMPFLDTAIAEVIRAENPAANFRSEAIYQEVKRITKAVPTREIGKDLMEWAREWADAIAFDENANLDPSTVNVGHANDAVEEAQEKGISALDPEDILEALNAAATTPNWTLAEVESLFDVTSSRLGKVSGEYILLDVYRMADEFAIRLKEKTMPKDRNALKRFLATNIGIKPADLQTALEGQKADWKNVEEAIEYAIIRVAKEIAWDPDLSEENKWVRIKELHDQQPLLSQRTSESIGKQQYSTPLPIAYLMGKWVDSDLSSLVFEPTAGTGMLLVAADPEAQIVANELDERRAEILKKQGYEVSVVDATGPELWDHVEEKEADAVLMNPPFGSIGKVIDVDGYSIRQRDHEIAMKTLKAMRDDGKAAIILGSHNLQEGHIRESDQPFINHIYGNYNVVGNIEVDGKVYRKQGTTWPIRIILISGRKPVPTDTMIGPNDLRVEPNVALYFDDVKRQMERAYDGSSELFGGKGRSVSGAEVSGGRERPPRPSRTTRPKRDPSTTGEQHPTDDSGVDISGVRSDVLTDKRTPGMDTRSKPGSKGRTDVAGDRGGDERPRRPDVEIVTGEHQTTYVPKSRGEAGNNKIPKRMAQSVARALDSIEKQVGDIDDYVAVKLDWPIAHLQKVFSAEQIDALALGFAQIDLGMALIVGDQTGVGKGRVAAGMIRYGNIQGEIPLFITAMPKLFTDMWRDLSDIGHKTKPFLMHSDVNKASIYDEEGEIKFKPHGNARTYRDMLSHPGGPKGWLKANGFGVVMLPYSQVQSPTSTLQREVLTELARSNYAILDESHRASGQSRIGEFFRQAIVAPAKGVVYLSATYAKRPDTMPLYFRTNIGATGMPVDQITEAVKDGGTALQSWMANALADSGQMIRRELDFAGISFQVQTDFANKDRDTKRVDSVTHILRNIVAFDKAKLAWVKELDRAEKDKERLETGGGRVSGGKHTLSSGVTSTNFSSTVHNVVNQLLLSVKADEAADRAIAALKDGKKPVINLMNTMQSFLDDLAHQEGVKEGEPIDFGFNAVLKRALRNTLNLTITDTKGKKRKQKISVEQIPTELQIVYQKIMKMIDDLHELDLPGSTIDYMIQKIRKAGYTVGEITGRSAMIDYSKEIPTYEKRSQKEVSDRNKPVIAFQKGKLDALIINAAGSTGLSLHAAPASDKKQRVMIVLQPDLNIDTFTQALGRIHRKGQVVTPEYILLQSAIPAEIRPGIVLRKKMSSLNANTTANTESGTSIDMPDMLNEYGDDVVVEFLNDNTSVNTLIGNPLGLGEGEGKNTADAFRRVTGRVALAPVTVQEKFYNAIQEMFLDKLEYLDQIGENNLRSKDFDLQAVPKRRVKLTSGTNEGNPLTASTFGDEMSVRVLKKPFNTAKIKELVDKTLEGREPWKVSNDIYRELERRAKIAEEELEAEYEGEDLNRMKMRLRGFLQRQHEIFFVEEQYKDNHWASGRHWRIGDTFKIGLSDDFDILGVLVGIKLPSLESAGLPIAPSRIKLKFAVNSSIQLIDIPLSSEVAFRTRKVEEGLDKNWEKKLLTADREDRIIVTGNLLEGFGKIPSGKGQLINFTDSKGHRHDGILLPQGKGLTDLGQAVIPWERAYEKFVAAHAEGRDSRMRSSDSESDQIRLSWGFSETNPTLIVPLPKNRGQKYWGDQELVDLTKEKRFDKSRSYSPFMKNRMVAIIEPAKLKEALAWMTVKHGIRWTEPASIEEVKDASMPEGPGGDTTLYSTPLDPELFAKSFRSVRHSIQEIRDTYRIGKAARRTDLSWFNKTVNTPYYIFTEKFPKWAPVFERARKGFQERDDIAAELSTLGLDYFNLEWKDKERVNKILIRGRFERKVYTDQELSDEFGWAPELRMGYFALRNMFDRALDLYEDGIIYRVTKGQIQSSSGIDLEVIAEVLKAIDFKKERIEGIIEILDKIRSAKRKGYAPFSRFGDFAYGLQRIKEDGTPGEIFYWATEETAYKAAKAYKKLLKRFDKSIAAGTMKPIAPFQMKEKEMKSLLQGIGGFELEILSRFLELEPDTADELKDAVEQLFQKSGFRKHFFESKDTPGFDTDMERATADYITGISGFISRIKMIPEMDELAKGMQRHPELAKYYKEWRDYITSPHEEYHRLRSGLFLYFLGGNVKSAAINLTQILVATIPWLSQYVSTSRAMVEATRAARTLINALGQKEDGTMGVVMEKLPKDVREIIRRGVQEGIISEQLVYELMGVAKKGTALRKISKEKQRVVRGFGFMFNITEKINRFVTMIAAARIHQSLMQKKAAGGGAAPPKEPPKGPPPTAAPFEEDPFDFSRRAVDETQFIYSKFNRPKMFRNFGSLFGVFRTFVVNILELFARFLRRRSWRAMSSAFVMLWALAGLKGIPFAEDLKWVIEQIISAFTHRTPDLETAVREWGYDTFGSPDFADYTISGAFRNVTGVDIGRSVGVGDVVPILGPDWEDPLAAMVGAPAEVLIKRPKRAYDFAMEGQTYRAVESVAPEFLRNPMYAARLLREGYLDRQGGKVVGKEEFTPFELGAKALGFTPTRVAKAQEREQARYRIGERTSRAKRDITREALKLANQGKYSQALAIIKQRAHGYRDEKNRDNIIFTGKKLPKDKADWIILDEYTLIRQLQESKLGPKWRGIMRQPTLQRPAFLKMNELYQ